MKALLLIVLVFGFLAGTDVRSQDGTKDKAILQGTWMVVSLEPMARKLTPEVLKAAKLVITGDKFTISIADSKDEASYKLDPTQKPKAIDVTDLRRQDAKPSPGIYLLEGDDLKLCWDANGASRPTAFTTAGKAGQDLRLIVLKREPKK
jgi:uncharacterized protein (TIGR03067 family)